MVTNIFNMPNKSKSQLKNTGKTPEKSGKKPQNTIHTVANAKATVC